MTDTKSLIPILEAYAQGKGILVRKPVKRGSKQFTPWEDFCGSVWNESHQYMIKPEPISRPFNHSELEELVGTTVHFKDTGNVYQLVSLIFQEDKGRRFMIIGPIGEPVLFDAKNLYEQAVFPNGSVFGVSTDWENQLYPDKEDEDE